MKHLRLRRTAAILPVERIHADAVELPEPDGVGKFPVVGDEHAPFAGGYILDRVERVDRRTGRTDVTALVKGPERVRGILHHRNTPRRGADAVGKAARTAEVFPRIAADQPRHCQRLYIVRRAVSGRIVHQQHRKALHGLGTQGGQALFEQRQTVVGHDDGRDISCVKHLFSGRICA